jgi:putative Ca2+/H+ antiporter (TMEM165/GDT1 family)
MIENLQQEKGWLWIIPISLILGLIFGIQTWSAVGLAFSAFYVLRVIHNMGHKIPVIDLMTALAALQWIVGPYIDYHNGLTHYKYHMYVPEDVYMAYAVPAIIAFRLGTLFFKDQSDLEAIGQKVTKLSDNYPRLPYLLIIGGLLIPYLNAFVPASLRFVFFLLANVKYIGVIYLLFSGKPNRWPVFIGVMTATALASIAAGMFHDLLLWAMLTFTFVAREMKLNYSMKLTFALSGLLIALTIQSVKHQYRTLIREGYGGNRTSLFMNLATAQWASGAIVNPTSEDDMNVRLNQGWIISAVMKNVPEKESYAGGATITEGITASLLPRFLAPNKKIAGGQENFRRFTGLLLGEGTSMGISLAGEGYANYGRWGGILFMFVWGLFIGWFWKKLGDWSELYPTLLIWSPILFLQVVKAETEFVVVLNHLIKASVLVFGLLWLIRKQWGIRI